MADQAGRVHPAQRRGEREGGRAHRDDADGRAAAVRVARRAVRRGRPAGRRARARRAAAATAGRAALRPALRARLPPLQRLHGLLNTDRTFPHPAPCTLTIYTVIETLLFMYSRLSRFWRFYCIISVWL